MPAPVGAGRDEVAVHRPVHVGGERDAVARVVVAGLGEGVEVRGLGSPPQHRLQLGDGAFEVQSAKGIKQLRQ
jgi:hypothetical protein